MAFSLHIKFKQKLNFKPSQIGKNLNNYSSNLSNFVLLAYLNSEPTESAVGDFCPIYGCKNLIKDNTCFKSPEKCSCIDLIITKGQTKMLSKSCDIRVVRFWQNDINSNKSILQKTKTNHYYIPQL